MGTVARAQALPDVPPMGDFLLGYEASAWFGIGAPKNTPPEIVDRLNKEINAGLADATIKARSDRLGRHDVCGVAQPSSVSSVASEIEKWGKVIRLANIKPGVMAVTAGRSRNSDSANAAD